MMRHLSFLGEVLKVKMCVMGVMGVPSNWIDERDLGKAELEVVCMGWRKGCDRLLLGGGGEWPRLVEGHYLLSWILCGIFVGIFIM